MSVLKKKNIRMSNLVEVVKQRKGITDLYQPCKQLSVKSCSNIMSNRRFMGGYFIWLRPRVYLLCMLVCFSCCCVFMKNMIVLGLLGPLLNRPKQQQLLVATVLHQDTSKLPTLIYACTNVAAAYKQYTLHNMAHICNITFWKRFGSDRQLDTSR